jgi:hypothetical protein
VKIETKEEFFLLTAAVAAIMTFQGTLALLAFVMLFAWEDSKLPAFDSDDYDRKMMNGPLKPWQKGN